MKKYADVIIPRGADNLVAINLLSKIKLNCVLVFSVLLNLTLLYA